MTLRNPPAGTECKECGNPCGHNLGCRVAHKEDRETIDRMRVAIGWALGDAPDAEGQWFGDLWQEADPGKRPRPYWWRRHLRKIAFGNEQTQDRKP